MMTGGAVSLRPESFVIPSICKLLLASNGDLQAAANAAPYAGVGARVVEVMKSLVDAGSTSGSDWSAIAPYKVASTNFLESLRNQSAFAALSPSFQPMPLRSNIVITSTTGTGYPVEEGKPKPLTRLELASDYIDAAKAVAIVVVSNEVARLSGELGERLIRNELRSAVALTVDQQFLSILFAAGVSFVTSFAATGNTAAALAADIRQAYLDIDVDTNSKLFWVASPHLAKGLATMFEADWVNPELGPQGGMLAGTPLVVSDAVIPDDVLWLIDSAKLGGSWEALNFSAAREADVELSDTPTDPADATAVMVSLWQHNLVGIRAELAFGVKPLRTHAIVRITSADYGG